ncbi:MAG: SRPBCC family protein [bacterium]
MTIIESGQETIAKPASEVYTFLVNCNNHEKLMPEQVEKWQSTENTCRFTIKGTVDLSLRVKETQENKVIVLEPYEKIPFPFTLIWRVEESAENSNVQAVLEADMNMFIKMVAAKPLENFLKHQLSELKTIMNG